MLILFPLAGIILAAMTVFFRGSTGTDILFEGIFYAFDYTLLLVLCYLAFFVFLALAVDLNKPNEKFSKFYNNFIIITLKMVLEACNVKVKVEGEEKIPKGRFLLVQNHLSMFDPISSVAYLGKHEIGFIIKPEAFRYLFINKFMHRICCLPIDRENARNAVKTINAAAENIKNDICSMAIYPEGTRAKDGKMLPFHAGSFKIATKSGAPIVVTTVSETNKVHKNAPWKRTFVTLRVCDVISAEEAAASSTAELSERARKAMCESLGIEECE
ncbi:MAG: 1-acyl-sn-glycerol-3-phosphate acyltransferase [Oscillospiraceae bacterium]|nr:1-acyl-sn-glycerol-3-phosphate acyltransferase [Oscillospiraceae bacterium]